MNSEQRVVLLQPLVDDLAVSLRKLVVGQVQMNEGLVFAEHLGELLSYLKLLVFLELFNLLRAKGVEGGIKNLQALVLSQGLSYQK